MVAVETCEFEECGRGLVAVTPIAAGELVLRESPVLLKVTQEQHQAVCALCLRFFHGKRISQSSAVTASLQHDQKDAGQGPGPQRAYLAACSR